MSRVIATPTDELPIGPAMRAPAGAEAVQRVVKVRRDYNDWVARETMEDYALRSFRKWSPLRVARRSPR